MISDQHADVLLTGYCGPNAFKALEAARVKVAGDVSGTVREAVAAFADGKVKLTSEPNADGHW
jgi:predicted Fe-Mo cluster-binding NifX family protein